MKRTPKPKLPHPLDVAFGARIKQVRVDKGLSQEIVARESGVTFQQLQKYERGENRVSFSRICEIAAALDISVPDLTGPIIVAGGQPFRDRVALLADPLTNKLVGAFGKITEPKVRQRVLKLVQSISDDDA